MKRGFLSMFMLLGLFVSTASGGDQNRIVGSWSGILRAMGAELKVVFNVTATDNGGLSGTLDSPYQNAFGIPVDTVMLKQQAVRFAVKAINGGYEGVMTTAGDSIKGTWTQNGMSFSLDLEKTKVEGLKMRRPQEPVRPYPYREEEVSYNNPDAAGVTLAGTLTLPESGGPFPAVLLISGSGPQDRDEALFGHKPFLVLSDYLTRRGIAVLRVDDRSVGKSTGDFANATTKDFAGDALAGVNYLAGRPDIRKDRIGLIGHSEGGIIAPMVAVQSSKVAFIVLLAGPSIPGSILLPIQDSLVDRANGVPEATVALRTKYDRLAFQAMQTIQDSAALAAAIEKIITEQFTVAPPEPKPDSTQQMAMVHSEVSRLSSSWFRYFMNYDPLPVLMKVQCPTLALFGGKDLQVPAESDAPLMKKALEANDKAETRVLPGLNHMFQTAATGSPNEYPTVDETISPTALSAIGDWIAKQCK